MVDSKIGDRWRLDGWRQLTGRRKLDRRCKLEKPRSSPCRAFSSASDDIYISHIYTYLYFTYLYISIFHISIHMWNFTYLYICEISHIYIPHIYVEKRLIISPYTQRIEKSRRPSCRVPSAASTVIFKSSIGVLHTWTPELILRRIDSSFKTNWFQL